MKFGNFRMKLLVVISAILVAGLVLSLGCVPQTAPVKPAPVTPPSAPSPKEPQAIKWIVQTNYGPGNANGMLIPVVWQDVIKEVTRGRLQFDIARPGSIVPVMESFDALKAGTLDALVITFPALYKGIMPEAFVMEGLPFAWQSGREVWHAIYDYGLLDVLRKAYAEQNIYNLELAVDVKQGITTAFPTYSPADIKGKKFIVPTAAASELFTYLGASTINVPSAERYMALSTKVADGIHLGIVQQYELKMLELFKYFNLGLDTGTMAMTALINLKSWMALPEDLRNTVDKYSRYVETMMLCRWDETSYHTWKYVKESGITVIDWPKEVKAELMDYAFNTYWKKVADKSPRNAQLVEIVKTQMRDLGRMK